MDVTWLPFELHPEVPPEGIAIERALPADYVARARSGMERLAAEVGLVMRPKERLINTRLALAAAEFARERGAFEPVHRAFFKGYWERTIELDRIDDLARVIAEHGLDPEELKGALGAKRYEPVIDRHRADAEAMGIDAIPAHVVGRRYLLIGAHPVETFREVLDRLAHEAEPADEHVS